MSAPLTLDELAGACPVLYANLRALAHDRPDDVVFRDRASLQTWQCEVVGPREYEVVHAPTRRTLRVTAADLRAHARPAGEPDVRGAVTAALGFAALAGVAVSDEQAAAVADAAVLLAEAVRLDEREACAAICERDRALYNDPGVRLALADAAGEIRERGTP